MLSTRLKNKRTEINMSIKELSEKTGLSSGFISQIEHGLSEPSITSLRNIAEVLGVPVFYFLLDDNDVNPVVKKDQRRILKFAKSNLTFELLSPDLNHQMEMHIAKIKPGKSTFEENEFHYGEEIIHIISGNMWILVGSEEYLLEEGDTIQFDSSKPHKMMNSGQAELKYLSVTTPPPENDSLKLINTKDK